MSEQELIPHLFRTEYSKIVAVLCSVLGPDQLQAAEDIAQDAFLAAAQSWGMRTVPENPTAWLYRVAKNKAIDLVRRGQLFHQKIKPEILHQENEEFIPEFNLSAGNISDSQLKMMFVVCHPSIPVDSQIALSLKILCGLGVREIAAAFLINEETVQKRISRAKEKLRTENIPMDIPGEQDIDRRLDAVLTVIYLLFNEGYYSSVSDEQIRKDLCLEAMRLCYLLLDNPHTATGSVYGLLSLMCFHASRFAARLAPDGRNILYDEQDRSLWDEELINKGNEFLIQGMQSSYIGKYQLEASIAYWHSSKIPHENKWQNILLLYDQLLHVDQSPMVALNRIYALSRVQGKEAAIHEALQLPLENNLLFHAILGELYTGVDQVKALQHISRALALTTHIADKKLLQLHLDQLNAEMRPE